jgi:hypothetical protein
VPTTDPIAPTIDPAIAEHAAINPEFMEKSKIGLPSLREKFISPE